MQYPVIPRLSAPPVVRAPPLWLSDTSPPGPGTHAATAAHPDFDVSALKGCRVVLVEDEVLVAMDIEYSLLDAGAIVIGPVGTVPASLQLVHATDEIDAAILDINLGGEDVYPVADELTARGVPFVFHTGHGVQLEIKSRFPTAAVCKKPITTDGLLAALAGKLATVG